VDNYGRTEIRQAGSDIFGVIAPACFSNAGYARMPSVSRRYQTDTTQFHDNAAGSSAPRVEQLFTANRLARHMPTVNPAVCR
jgi:hypothetical protein